MATSTESIIVDQFHGTITVDIPIGMLSAPMFKLKLKRYFSSMDTFPMVVDPTLSMGEISSMVQNLSTFAKSKGVALILTESFTEYCSRQENHIKERRELGSMIKSHKEYIDLGFEEFSDTVNGIMHRPLRDKQMWDAYFMCVMNRSCNFSVPGSGKTAAALGTYSFLKSRGSVDRIFLIGPISCFGSWIDEFTVCFGESPVYYNIQGEKSREAIHYHLRLETGNVELFLFNYESIVSHCDDIKKYILSDDRTLVILDEVHRIKAVEGQRARATMDVVKDSRYIISMTGTPIPNSYEDIYNLFNIVFGKNYKNFLGYEPNELSSIKDEYDPKVKVVNDAINPFFCRTTKEDLGVPPSDPDIIYNVDATEYECRLFDELSIRLQDSKLALMIRLLQMESDPRMILDILTKNDLDDLELERIPNMISLMPMKDMLMPDGDFITSKTRVCINLATSLLDEGKAIIIWCVFRHSIDKISSMLTDQGFKVEKIYGPVPVAERTDIIKRFKDHKFQVLVANPHTLAESVSLHTVCHDAIYYEYTFNLVHFLQSRDRIHRLGLPEDQYTRFHILNTVFDIDGGKISLDDKVYQRLLFKNTLMMDAIERDAIEIMPTDEDDLNAVMSELFDSYRRFKRGR